MTTVSRKLPAGLIVRPMQPSDREAVAGLLLLLNRFEDAMAGDRHVTEDAGFECLADAEGRIARHGGEVLVAEAEGGVAGILILVFGDAEAFVRPDLRPSAYVLDLVVAEGFRSRGIARLLLGEAESIAREAGRSALLVGALSANDAALGLYDSAGFRRQAIEFLKPLRDFRR